MALTFTNFIALIAAKTGNTKLLYEVVAASTVVDLWKITTKYAEALSLTDKDIPIPKDFTQDKGRRSSFKFTFDSELDLSALNNSIIDTELQGSVSIPNLEGSATTLSIRSTASRTAANSSVPEL